MHLRYGGIFNDCFITRLLLSLKTFEHRSTFGDVIGKSRVSCFLFTR